MFGKKRENLILMMRNVIFGVEDSLVSTVGLVSGVASAGSERITILMTGTILILVEAFSMAVGSYLSERATHEKATDHGAERTRLIRDSIAMFCSYIVAGFIPLVPYMLIDPARALVWSIGASLVALFALGVTTAEILKTNPWKGSARMVLLGGIAILLGVVVGVFFKN